MQPGHECIFLFGATRSREVIGYASNPHESRQASDLPALAVLKSRLRHIVAAGLEHSGASTPKLKFGLRFNAAWVMVFHESSFNMDGFQ